MTIAGSSIPDAGTLKGPRRRASAGGLPSRIVAAAAALLLGTPPASGHPGSGIVVDAAGQVFFVDTGVGVWKIDREGRLLRHPGPAYHWMALDRDGRLTPSRDLGVPGGEVFVGSDPRLIVSSDFPLAVGTDGALYYPEVRDDRVRIQRRPLSGRSETLAVLPVAREVGPDGRAVEVRWIHGLAAGPDGSLYYSERHAVRRIAPDGTVSAVAEDVEVPECVLPPAVSDERLRPGLYGLDVAPDGTVYVAATLCSAVARITRDGGVAVVLRGSDGWAPTGVVVAGDHLYVLEYRYIPASRREDWLPRVRRVTPGSETLVVAEIRQR